MGLDQHARYTHSPITQGTDFERDFSDTEFHYWRKHPNLQGWMEKLYYKKGGTAKVFNCVSVQLTQEDLLRLQQAVLGNNLPETDGFFFGKSYGDEQEDDLKFISEALNHIAEGKSVYYTSSW